jgi:pilus assembly protein CpaD
MKQIKTKNSLQALVLAVVLPAVLTGCYTDRVRSYTEIQAVREAEILWVDMPHEVMFDVGEHKLTEHEADRLTAFLDEIGIKSSDKVVIDPGSTRGGIVEPRIEAVTGFLGHRVSPNAMSITHLGWAETDERMRIIVGRYLAIPPDCPNFVSPSHRNPNNLTSSNHGCANTTNLALMIADPGDLIRGKGTSQMDASVGVAAVSRYRSGAVRNAGFRDTLSSSESE